MKLYTSYWAQVRNFPRNLVGLNTTIWPPKWRPLGKDERGIWVIDCPPFKPGIECSGMCNGPADCHQDTKNCAFLNIYANQLDKLDFKYIIYKLFDLHENLARDGEIEDCDFAFIVYEKYDNPCSERWPIQKWFKKNGAKIEEWHK
jgi:hypothetical protein